MTTTEADVAIVGAGAAGLMSATFAGRGGAGAVVALDSARTLGAKILVAGGGRCNVTHDVVDETAYAGSSRNAIKKVLRRFGVEETIGFFRELGVELKREETGKLFPVSDNGRDVLDALIRAVKQAGAEVRHPYRVGSIRREGDGFVIEADASWPNPEGAGAAPRPVRARRVILATGGRSLPKTGSDGGGYALARALGHTITPRVFPALVPLTLPKDFFLCALSGLTLPATLEVRSGAGKRIAWFTDSTLLTHFGLSGPSVLDISRYYADARADDPRAALTINFLPGETTDAVDAALQALGRATVGSFLRAREALPERLARALCAHATVDPATIGSQLSRERRRALAVALTALPLPITGDRGYTYAEVTAGGVPLGEIRLETMESRVCPGLHLVGEICDVDGRIGGYNFQWAWASGFIAGTAAAEALRAGERGRAVGSSG